MRSAWWFDISAVSSGFIVFDPVVEGRLGNAEAFGDGIE